MSDILELLKNLDQVAGEFESCWIRADGQLRIEDFLDRHSELPGDRLTREIVAVEIELRFNTGEVPNAAEYASRFPILDRRWLDKVIESATANSQTDEQKTLHPENDDWSGAPNPVGDSDKSTLDPAKNSGARHPAPKFSSFGDYEIIEEIARGGMGVVYKARQKSLNRTVALKMILSGQLAGDEEIQRFRAEAEAAANLDHPGIVPIYEIGQHEGHQYFSMGFVEGKSLQAKLIDGPLPHKEAAELVKKIAEAIAYAHDHNVIHRDLKPANVLIESNGEPRVTDFGLAKLLGSDSDLTGTGQILGTPGFMPPEQASGQSAKVDERADVWSLGGILYNLITGRPPFQAATPLDTLKQVIDKEPVSPRKLVSTIPRDLETICLKCLRKESAHRYQSARTFVSDVNNFLTGKPINARRVSHFRKGWMRAKRNKVKAVLLLMLATSLLYPLAMGLFSIRPDLKRMVASLYHSGDKIPGLAMGNQGLWMQNDESAEDVLYSLGAKQANIYYFWGAPVQVWVELIRGKETTKYFETTFDISSENPDRLKVGRFAFLGDISSDSESQLWTFSKETSVIEMIEFESLEYTSLVAKSAQMAMTSQSNAQTLTQSFPVRIWPNGFAERMINKIDDPLRPTISTSAAEDFRSAMGPIQPSGEEIVLLHQTHTCLEMNEDKTESELASYSIRIMCKALTADEIEAYRKGKSGWLFGE